MSKRSRSQSKNSYYSTASDQYVDTKSKQLLFHQADLCTLGRTRLTDDEDFKESVAKELLEKHCKKRKSHGIVLCLVDRLRFQKFKNTASKFYRKDLTYRDIKYFYFFKSMPCMFTLGVVEEKTGVRTYESFKCKKEIDVQMLHKLTAIAFQDPQFLLHHALSTRQISMSPSPSNDSRNENGPVVSNSIKMVSADPNRNSLVYYGTYDRQHSPTIVKLNPSYQFSRSPQILKPLQQQGSPPSRNSSDELVQHRDRSLSIERRLDYKERSSTVASTISRNGTLWSEDITYLKTDPENGPQLTDCGPIYIFVSRNINTHGNGSQCG